MGLFDVILSHTKYEKTNRTLGLVKRGYIFTFKTGTNGEEKLFNYQRLFYFDQIIYDLSVAIENLDHSEQLGGTDAILYYTNSTNLITIITQAKDKDYLYYSFNPNFLGYS